MCPITLHKLKFTEALMDDLHDLTDRVYVMF